MGAGDMIAVTNGEHTIEVTEKAFHSFYGENGYELAEGDTPKEPSFNDKKKAIKAAGIELPAHANKEAVDALYATIPPEGDTPKEPEE